MTDHPVIYGHLLLLTTRWFLRYGYKKEEAINIITERNAKNIGY